jgi:hypothetical protein
MDKAELHAALQEQARTMTGVPPGAYLARWVVVRELVLPDGTRVLNRATGDASGQLLTPWDVEGFLRYMLRNLAAGQVPPPQPPEGEVPF